MRFSSLTVLALVSSMGTAFSPNAFKGRFAVQNIPMRRKGSSSIFMAADDYNMDTKSDPPKKKTKKEEQLDAIEASMRQAEARRKALEEEFAAAEAERIKLEEELAKAAAMPEPKEPGEGGGLASAATVVVGGVAVAAGVRTALQGREKFAAEQERKEQIRKAAAEQDARNKAAAAAKEAATGSAVSIWF